MSHPEQTVSTPHDDDLRAALLALNEVVEQIADSRDHDAEQIRALRNRTGEINFLVAGADNPHSHDRQLSSITERSASNARRLEEGFARAGDGTWAAILRNLSAPLTAFSEARTTTQVLVTVFALFLALVLTNQLLPLVKAFRPVQIVNETQVDDQTVEQQRVGQQTIEPAVPDSLPRP